MARVPSEQFVASHLQRASVITPVDAAGTAGGAAQQAQQGEGANGALAAGSKAGSGGKEGGGQGQGQGEEDEEEEEEEGEEHHAAGMGCTAVSVLVRGDRVLVANTGGQECTALLLACLCTISVRRVRGHDLVPYVAVCSIGTALLVYVRGAVICHRSREAACGLPIPILVCFIPF